MQCICICIDEAQAESSRLSPLKKRLPRVASAYLTDSWLIIAFFIPHSVENSHGPQLTWNYLQLSTSSALHPGTQSWNSIPPLLKQISKIHRSDNPLHTTI